MNKLLKLPAAILILILLFPVILKYFVTNKLDLEILNVISYLIWFFWCGMLSLALIKRVPRRIEFSERLFYINYFFLFIVFTIPELVPISFYPDEDSNFNIVVGWSYLILLLFSVIQLFNQLSYLLTSIEEQREVLFRKRFGDFIMFLIFPFGVWFLQPRIIKVLEKPEVAD